MTFRDISPEGLNKVLDYNEKVIFSKNQEIKRLQEENIRLTNIVIDLRVELSKLKDNAENTKRVKGCGKHFEHGIGEVICGSFYIGNKLKLCPECEKESKEDKHE